MSLWHGIEGVKSEDVCDWQMYLIANATHPNATNGTVMAPWCPEPNYTIPDSLSPETWVPVAGMYKFRVYRALNSQDNYAEVLANSNAADASGVLSYLHFEVVPADQQNPTDPNLRHYNVDSIGVFEVELVPSSKVLNNPHQLGRYTAFDAGKCTVPNCDALLEADGYTPGVQVGAEGGYAYNPAVWYSFPSLGKCAGTDHPDGVKCTYNFKVLGKIPLDSLINLHQETGYWDIESYRKDGLVEFSRESKTDGACVTTGGIDFWKNPCNASWSAPRVEALLRFKDFSPMKETNIQPPDRNCLLAPPPTPAPTPTPAPPDGPGGGDNSDGFIPGLSKVVSYAVVGGGAFVVLAAIGFFCLRKKSSGEAEPLLNDRP